MPMPAPNIIDNHVNVPNSGCSPLDPNLNFPIFGNTAKSIQIIIKNAVAYIYQPPNNFVERSCISINKDPAVSGYIPTQKIKERIKIFGVNATVLLTLL